MAPPVLTATRTTRAGRPAPLLRRSSINSYALFWALGAAFLWWPWALARAVAGWRRGDQAPASLLLIAGLLTLSLTLAAVLRPDPSRLVAAVANLTVWVTLAVWTGRRWKRSEVDGVLRGIVDLAVIQAVLAVVALIIHPALSEFELPLARILPEAVKEEPNVAALSTVRLAYADYFGGPVLRTAGLFGNATWAGGLAGLGLVVLLFGSDRLSPALQRPPVRASMVALCAVSLYLSYARVDVLALVAAAAGIWALRHRHVVSIYLAAAGLALVGLSVSSFDLSAQRWFDRLNEPRRGSLESRSDIYRRTIEEIADAPVPLVGAGVKEREPRLVASIGSHSTYLGLAYRGGVLSAIGFVFFLGALLGRGWRQVSPLAVGLTLLTIVWCATEDVDAGHLMPLGILAAFCLAHQPQPERSGRERGGRTLHEDGSRLSASPP